YRAAEPLVAREFDTPHMSPPRTQILSNGRYHVMVTTSGAGYSEFDDLRLTRWREDPTCDPWGFFCYLRNSRTGEVWSATHQPVGKESTYYHVNFAEDRVSIVQREGSLETQTQVCVSGEDNAEVRRIDIVNSSGEVCEIEATSYMELVLTKDGADMAHPAFSNLFVETEYLPEEKALLATRRSRSPDEKTIWAAHLMTWMGEGIADPEFETDRSKFIGRTQCAADAAAIQSSGKLSGSTGAVLDPIFSWRCKLRIEPYSKVEIAFTLVTAETREQCIELAEKYRDHRNIVRAFETAMSHAQVRMRELGIAHEEANLFQRIAGRILYSSPSLRPAPIVIARNTKTQAGLWAYGISGDLPICLVRIEEKTDLEIVRQLLRAHEYWRTKGLVVDLVILNEYPSSYFEELEEELLSAIRTGRTGHLLNQPGGIFVLKADTMPEEDR